MTDPVWRPEEAARLLAEVYGGSLGEACDIDPVTKEELARAGRGVPRWPCQSLKFVSLQLPETLLGLTVYDLLPLVL